MGVGSRAVAARIGCGAGCGTLGGLDCGRCAAAEEVGGVVAAESAAAGVAGASGGVEDSTALAAGGIEGDVLDPGVGEDPEASVVVTADGVAVVAGVG